MRSLLILCLFYCLVSCVEAQELQFNTTNYNIEDGLPSNECHDILQDSTGYIWIATDRGLVRFDGYEFKTYGVPHGLKDISCLDMVFDEEQNIWIHTFGGNIFIYEQEKDSLHLYQHQHLIDSFLVRRFINDLAVSKDNQLVLAIPGIGFLIIDNKTGRHQLKRATKKEGQEINFTLLVKDNLLISYDGSNENLEDTDCINMVYSPIFDSWFCQHYIDYATKRYKGDLGDLLKSKHHSRREAYQLRDSLAFINLYGASYFFQEDSLLSYRMDNQHYLDVLPYNTHSFLAGLRPKGGLQYYGTLQGLQNNQSISILKNISISRILKDKKGDIWCTSLENGLYYLKEENIKVLKLPQLLSANIKHIETGNNELYLLEGKEKVFRLKNNEIKLLIDENKDELKSINYSNLRNGLFISGRTLFLSSDNNIIQPLKLLNNNLEASLTSICTFEFENGELFFPWSSSLAVYKNIDSTQVYRSSNDENIQLRVLAVEKVAKEHFLLGTTTGLKQYGNKSITDLEGYPQELQLRINAIKKIENWFVFGTQGNGLVFWDLQDSVINIRKSEGLLSNNIESIFVDDKEQLFLATKSGLSKIWLDGFQKIKIKNYTTVHGLPSNEVNDIDQMGDTIYIATGKGVATLLEDPDPVLLHQPIFTDVQINETIYHKNNFPSILGYKENNLRIAYKTIDHKMQGAIRYRYQINENGWIESSGTEVNYPTLSSGNYTFQLQSKNTDDVWSKSIKLNFEIQKPWWQSYQFFIGVLLFGFLGIRYYLKYKADSFNKAIAIDTEMRDLERAALQAQMNPHFIFNSLNSIQNFIMENDKENAMEYLATFAQLIRQSLNASTQNKISLDKEILMLTNYLELEKLRFKSKFNFNIEISDNIDTTAIKIPTLLIQPFVENAIIHGFGDNSMRGRIDVVISKIDPDEIKVLIKDNGKGKSGAKLSAKHKSFGMSITGKRLALNNRVKDDSFKILPNYTDDGTEVIITIKV